MNPSLGRNKPRSVSGSLIINSSLLTPGGCLGGGMRICMNAQVAFCAITRARLGSANATAFRKKITVMEQFLLNSLSLSLGIWQI